MKAAYSSLRQRATQAMARRAAFTLLEILFAVTIGGMLMIGAISFAFSMSELWGQGTEYRLFDQHVRGVSRFLDHLMREAEAPPPEPTGGIQNQPAQGNAAAAAATGAAVAPATDLPVAWQTPRGREFGTQQFLAFQLPESPGVFAWPGQPLPFVVCWLRVDPRRGLFLLWKSRLEVDFDDVAPREFRVSPFVTGIKYYYYDTTGRQPRWEEREEPRVGAGRVLDLPARIRLTFEYDGDQQVADLVLPGATTAVPLY